MNRCKRSGGKCNGSITSHVFLTLKYHETISSVGLLLLVRSLVGMVICNDPNLASCQYTCRGLEEYFMSVYATYTFDGPKAAELLFKITLLGIIAEAGNNQCFERIAADVTIISRVICYAQSVSAPGSILIVFVFFRQRTLF